MVLLRQLLGDVLRQLRLRQGRTLREVIRRLTVVHALELLRRDILGLDVEHGAREAEEDREERG